MMGRLHVPLIIRLSCRRKSKSKKVSHSERSEESPISRAKFKVTLPLLRGVRGMSFLRAIFAKGHTPMKDSAIYTPVLPLSRGEIPVCLLQKQKPALGGFIVFTSRLVIQASSDCIPLAISSRYQTGYVVFLAFRLAHRV